MVDKVIVELDQVIDGIVANNVNVQIANDALVSVNASKDAMEQLADVEFPSAVQAEKDAIEQLGTDTKADFDAHTSSADDDFNALATLKLGEYETNADDRLEEYNTNDAAKTSAFNDNYATKFGLFNTEYVNRVEDVLKTAGALGAIFRHEETEAPSVVEFPTTINSVFLYYRDGVYMVEGVDYTVGGGGTTIVLTTDITEFEVIIQVDTNFMNKILEDMGVEKYVFTVATYAALPAIGALDSIYIIQVDETSNNEEDVLYKWSVSGYKRATAKVGDDSHDHTHNTLPADIIVDADVRTAVSGSNKIITELDLTDFGGGDMTKVVYDSDNSGVVDSSELLEGNDSAYHLDRVNQTGTQDLDTITETATKKILTAAERIKLSGLTVSLYLGSYTSLVALETAYPTASVGNYADVDAGLGEEIKRYIWDSTDTEWVHQLGTSALLTDAQVKNQYENNINTNVFDDNAKDALADSMSQTEYASDSPGVVNTSEDLEHLNQFGIVEGCVFTKNGAYENNYDVSPGVYYLAGIRYEFLGATNRPSLGLAGTFAHVKLTALGLVDVLGTSVGLSDNEQALEITTYAKLSDTVITTIGNSSDNTADIIQDLYLRMKFFEHTLFKDDAGKILASATPLQLNMLGGTVSAPNGKRVTLASASDIGVGASYHIAGVEKLQPTVTPFVIDNTVYDDGIDLVPITTEGFVTHTLSVSVRSKTPYFTYGKTVHGNLGQAEAQLPDIGTFQGTSEGSFIEPLALVIMKEGVPGIVHIVDIRGGKEANTLDSIAGKTIASMVSGDVLTFDGNKLVAETPASNAGQGVSYFLGDTLISGGNYNLSIFPEGGVEQIVNQTANSGNSPRFIERYVSDALGGTSINAGAWTFRTYASVSANAGDTNIIARMNKDVLKEGIVTSTGAGVTRTFTASEPGTFVPGDASASILDATLIQTPGETFFIDAYISDTQVTASSENAAYVNESSVSFSLFYKLFEVEAAHNITGAVPALYEVNSVQPAFAINPEDKLLIAYFLDVTSGNNKTVSLYKNGSENYSHFLTPLLYRHNGLGGLNEGDYQHITQAEKVKYESYENTLATILDIVEW